PKRGFSCIPFRGPDKVGAALVRSQAAYRLCYAARMRSTIVATILLAGAAAAAQAPQPWTLKIEPLQLAAQRGSSGAQLTVSKRGVLVSWLDSDNDEPTLKFAER